MNGLTRVNQAFTFAAGDRVLQAVASRLVVGAGGPDRVARIAGDEFAVLLPEVVGAPSAAEAAQRLLAAVRGPIDEGEHQIEITACVGIAPATGQAAEDLLRDAGAAMRQAAATGSDRWAFLGGDVGADTRRSLSLQAGLRQALAADEVRAWFMPIVDLGAGTLRGYEALARWLRPDGTILGPAESLASAEQTNIIIEIDRTILHQAVAALHELPDAVHVAVNTSAVTLSSVDIATWVRDELDGSGIDPRRLHLEVSETALLHVTDRILATMTSIAQVGVSWWVDDFGTGFSSITHLRDLPVRGLKLDLSFTQQLSSRSGDRPTRLASGLAGLAQGMGLATVAEGIETPEQARILAAQGWQMGQGWLYGKAAPLDEAVRAAHPRG